MGLCNEQKQALGIQLGLSDKRSHCWDSCCRSLTEANLRQENDAATSFPTAAATGAGLTPKL